MNWQKLKSAFDDAAYGAALLAIGIPLAFFLLLFSPLLLSGWLFVQIDRWIEAKWNHERNSK